MALKKLITPFRVGLLVLVSGFLLFVFVTFAGHGSLSSRDSVEVYAYFKDASGVGPKSRIQVAGIPVGEVREMVLEGTRARATLRIRKDVNLKIDAALSKRSESLLGDYVLDLVPGGANSAPMPPGGEIVNIKDTQGMEAVLSTLESITGDVKQVTKSLSQVLGGEPGQQSLQQIVDNLVKISDSVEQTAARSGAELDVILRNVKSITGTLQGMTTGEERTLHEIVQNIQMITRDTRQVMAAARQFVGEDGEGVRSEVESLKTTLARLDNSLKNVEEVTEKVKNGEGTLGKLVSDERLGQRLGETVEDVADFTQRLTQLQAEVSVRSDYLFNQGQAKTFFDLRLIPKPDRYYLLELVDDPRGSISTQVVQTNPPAEGQPVSQIQRTVKESLKVSALFAKRFYFATARFGLIENTGGVGLDLHFWKDHISVRTDVFNFADRQLKYPRLRSALRIQAFDHLFVNAGIDDALNPRVRDQVSNRLLSGRDFFLGAGIYFTDDDLKSLITVAGVPSP